MAGSGLMRTHPMQCGIGMRNLARGLAEGHPNIRAIA
jgi:hypothetical protein